MKRHFLLAAAILGGIFLAGCASGPKFSEIASSIAPIPAGDGRIYFFRSSSMMGAAIQPDIRLNGQVVGTSKPGGFFFVDRPAGTYAAATSTEAEKSASFALDVGETKYVRTSPSFGLVVGRVNVEIEDPAKAKAEIQTLSMTGGNAKAASATAAPATSAAVPAAPITLASAIAAAQPNGTRLPLTVN